MDFIGKRRAFGAFCILGGILFTLLLFSNCNDFGVEADFICCNIQGEIVINTVVPQNTDEIRVAVSQQYPPIDILSLIFTNALPVSKDTTITSQRVPFNLAVPKGEYAAVFVIWKEEDKSFNPADVIGLYGDLLTGEPIPVSITDADSVAENVDMEIDFTKVLRNAKIEGRIDYVKNGVPAPAEAWPSNTGVVAMGVFREIPAGFTQNNFDIQAMNSSRPFVPDDFNLLLSFEVLPIRVQQYEYRLRVSPADVKLVALFWLPEGDIITVVNRIQVLGFYRDPNSPQLPGQFTIAEEQTVTGIDITAEFATCLECAN